MVEMNPYYARSSNVGDVFDVATWSTRKALTVVAAGVIMGFAFGAGAFYAWDPHYASSLVVEDAPEMLQQANDDLADTHEKHPWAVRSGIGLLALLSFFCALGVVCSAFDFAGGEYYLRAGPGGLSFRLPAEVIWGRLGFESTVRQFDIGWNEIRDWEIVQKKQFGALSANAGNLDAHLKIVTNDGAKRRIELDLFREPARIIHNRIQEAVEMTAARFEVDEDTERSEELIGAGADE